MAQASKNTITAAVNLRTNRSVSQYQSLLHSCSLYNFSLSDFFYSCFIAEAIMANSTLLYFNFLFLLSWLCLDRDNCCHCKRLHQHSLSYTPAYMDMPNWILVWHRYIGFRRYLWISINKIMFFEHEMKNPLTFCFSIAAPSHTVPY